MTEKIVIPDAATLERFNEAAERFLIELRELMGDAGAAAEIKPHGERDGLTRIEHETAVAVQAVARLHSLQEIAGVPAVARVCASLAGVGHAIAAIIGGAPPEIRPVLVEIVNDRLSRVLGGLDRVLQSKGSA